MPKITRGLTNPAKGKVDALNSHGTQFSFGFQERNKDGSFMFDKWVCVPGEQFIDSVSWVQELLIVLKAGAK